MADADPKLTTIPFAVTDPERIPSARYYDEQFYKLENERLWPHAWQMACRVEMLPNVGDWTEYANLGKSVIVVRTTDGLRAFQNTCRHRGVKLAEGHGNCAGQGFVCPFHGWRWNAAGKNTFVYGRHLFDERQLDADDLDLVPVRLETWAGCAWINLDSDAPALRECLGGLAEDLDLYRVPEMRAEWWYATVLPANWKTAMEAFMEGYHVMRTHPQIHAVLPTVFNGKYGQAGGMPSPINPQLSIRQNIDNQIRHMETLCEGMAGMCHAKDVEVAKSLVDVPLPDDLGEAMRTWFALVKTGVSEAGRERGEPTPDLLALSQSNPIRALEYVFPHYFMLPYLSSFSAYRVRPLGPESCLFELWSLTLFPEGQEAPPVMEPTFLRHDSEQFPPIPRQDYENIPRQQEGLRSEGFEFMRLSSKVEGMISNYNRLIDGYLAGVAPESLAAASRALAHNFDGPIKDIGF
jgi:phenylpropionate dioxygenase-like ring-hydroxylating dioxygenase large terminal subunit